MILFNRFLRLSVFTLCLVTTGFAQGVPDTTTTVDVLTVFLDCNRCDEDYIRREITFVNYVRDRTQAQVHLLITTQSAGAGRAYTLNFIGQDAFEAIDDTLQYTSSNTDTDDERRRGLAQVIKMGLVRYVARTPMALLMAITFDDQQTTLNQTTSEDDPWNFWVFRVGLDGSFEAEEAQDAYRIGTDLDANRITEDWKISFSIDANYRENNFEIDDETITSIQRSGRVRGLAVKSLGSHWSAGAFASLNTSSFNNTALSTTISSALEYNVFPYAESSRRQFRLNYFLDLRSFDYEKVTIFEKTSEVVLRQNFEAILEFEQPWGEAIAVFEASTYLTDFEESMLDLYRLELFGYVEARLVRGLSLFARGNISRIRDQIFLPQEEASEEDILLGNVRLPTSFDYGFSLGLSYTFGSIYNNIVNPRFGS